MSDNLHTYEIIGKDPFNIKILNETLWDIKEMIFDNLYRAQRSISGILRFDFTMDQYSKKSKTEYIYNLNTQFISNENRINYKKSSFYKKDLSLDDIITNTNIFYNTVLVFINGELYTNVYVRPIEDFTSIIFKVKSSYPTQQRSYIRDGFTYAEMDELVESKAKLTVFIVNNHNQTNYNINRFTLNNYMTLNQYKGIPIVEFQPKNSIKLINSFTTWVTYDDIHLFKYRMLSSYEDEDKVKLNIDEASILTNTYTYLKNIYLPNHMQLLEISDNFFELEIKDMPVPCENMMIFRKSGNTLFFDHETTITCYYPNIYEIHKNHDDPILIHIYYADDTKIVGTKYQNELSLYYRFTKNILEKYKDQSIPDIIKNYKPITMDYDFNDLKNDNIDHLNYKFNKLNEMIYQNGHYYSIYLDKLVGYVPTFFIDVSQIDDLGSRYRTNNRTEVTDPAGQINFKEPCYLFMFRHHSNRDKIRITIDELYTNDLYTFYDARYMYVYIPQRLVSNTSIITVEKFLDYLYDQEINITDTHTYHKINIPETQKFQVSDIFISTRSVTGEEVYMSRNDYKLYIFRDNKYEEITNNNFYNYKQVYVRFASDIDIGKSVFVHVKRINFKQVQYGNSEFFINRIINNDGRNILTFKNGQLVPKSAVSYKFNDKVAGPHRVKALLKYDPEDEYTLVYNTNKYFLVHYQEEINSNGLVDLTGKISKPLNFKWYDIYLNGLKMDESTVEFIAPYIMIIKNVNTIRNLELYEKNLDNTTWADGYPTSDISKEIFDEIINDIESDLDEIPDDMEDILDDRIVDMIGFLEEYIFNLKLINPDLKQITNIMLRHYPELFDEKKSIFMNPDKIQFPIEGSIYFQPDKGTLKL